MIATRDPFTGEVRREYEALSAAQVMERIDRAAVAFERYRETSFAQRAEILKAAADILEAERKALGALMTQEMGKPVSQGVAEAEKCAWVCRYYAGAGEAMLALEPIDTDERESYLRYDPLGPILAVMPWNFPLWQVFRFAAPTLMAGNVALLKHASNVPACALAIEEIFSRAGAPAGVFQTLLVETDLVEMILDDRRVRAATLTGSTGAGSAVAGQAGTRIKKTVLELGGSDPFVVMPSANIARAARTAVAARTVNSGQSCIAAKRFIIHDSVYDDFVTQFVEGMRDLRVGDPSDPDTDIGPLATEDLRDTVAGQVQQSVDMGARLLLGGHPLPGPGSFFPPTVLVDVPDGSPAHDEEIFGPVASLFRAKDLAEAIRLANDSSFGLGSSFWSDDENEQQAFIAGIEAGQVFINAMVASDPRLPFGGVRDSGYGRELGVPGIREFVNIKTVSIVRTDESASISSHRRAVE
jgi:succinate-semialdehyde dehydrogenase / glutarate-semialdehyde dehydrogenase